MKIILKVLYGIVLIYIGTNIYNSSIIEKEQTFFLEETVESISNDNYNLYLNNTMVQLGATSYINEPIYKINSKKEGLTLTFEVYHFEVEEKKSKKYGIAFYLNDIKLNEEFDKLEFVLIFENTNYYTKEEVYFKYNGNNINSNMLYALMVNDDFKSFDNKTFNQINNLLILNNDNEIVEIKTNKNAEVDIKNEKDFDFKNNKLIFEEFNSNLKSYEELKDFYNDEDLINKVDYTNLKPYNKIVTKNMITYGIMAIIGTALVLFMEPLIRFAKSFSNKNENNTNND